MIYVTPGGQVAKAIYVALKQHFAAEAVSRATASIFLSSKDLIIAAQDNSDVDALKRWEAMARRAGARMLCVHLHGGEAIIGPEIIPQVPGCVYCWSRRYFAGRPKARKYHQAASRNGTSAQSDPWITALAADVIAQIVTGWVAFPHAMSTRDGTEQRSKIYFWDLRTLKGRTGYLLPDPGCENCVQMPPDNANSARIVLAARLKPYSGADHLREAADLQAQLEAFCVGQRTALLPKVTTAYRHHRGAVAIAELSLPDSIVPEPCSGFSNRYSAARTVAMLETVERYCSSSPQASRPGVRASLATLADPVADPRRFGLYVKEDYQANAGLLSPFGETFETEFVWGHSFHRDGPLLVPLQLAFYSLQQPRPLFVIEGSSGCAIGNCPEEALFHALLEVIERDSLLLTWYARVRRMRIDPLEADDAEIRCRLRRLQLEGFDVLVLDVTTEFGIPAVWVTARRRHGSQLPYAVSAGAAHVRAEQALRKAFRELDATLNRFMLDMTDPDLRRRAFELSEDPRRVKTMLDHGLFYTVPASGSHLDFLWENSQHRSLADLNASAEQFRSQDLTDELRSMIAKILECNCDVIAVNQSPVRQRDLGLYVYKVLVPGAIPISWGQHRRRITGLSRLCQAMGLGATESASASSVMNSAVNQSPHPFL